MSTLTVSDRSTEPSVDPTPRVGGTDGSYRGLVTRVVDLAVRALPWSSRSVVLPG